MRKRRCVVIVLSCVIEGVKEGRGSTSYVHLCSCYLVMVQRQGLDRT